MSKRHVLLAIIALLLAALVPLAALAQTAAPTDQPTHGPCDYDKVYLTLVPMGNSQPASKSETLDQLSDLSSYIQQQLVNCDYQTKTPLPSETPLPTATKVGTLTFKEAATATYAAVYAARTATSGAVTSTATFKAAYKQIDPRELINYPQNHIGEKVIVQGTVFSVHIPDGVIQVYVNGSYSYPLYVEFAGTLSSIYENDYVTIYGTIAGTATFENVSGGTVSQTKLTDAVVVKQGG